MPSPIKFDELIERIADYVDSGEIKNQAAYEHARLCLLDSLACAFIGMRYPDCKKLLGPLTRHSFVDAGVRVPGTHFEMNPVDTASITFVTVQQYAN